MIEKYLDHTNLKLGASSKDIKVSVKEAIMSGSYGFCTYIGNHMIVDQLVAQANSLLKKVYVIGFPEGGISKIKRDLAHAKYCNADEFDVVLPLSEFLKGKLLRVEKALNTVRKETEGKVLKVIIETVFLTDEKKMWEAVKIVDNIGADYVKTNTGVFKPRCRPVIEDVEIIKNYTKLKIKAAGGIKTYELAKKLVDMGVSRIGTSNALSIIEEEKKTGEVNVSD